MSFKTEISFLLILVFGIQINSYGQTITFKILKQMVASRAYKDSIVDAFKFIKGAHIPADLYGVESESYMSPDSSKFNDVVYMDSAISVTFWAKELILLQKIILDGQIAGFAKTTIVSPNPKTVAYIKGKYLLTFNNKDPGKKTGNVSLIKNYQVFINWLKLHRMR